MRLPRISHYNFYHILQILLLLNVINISKATQESLKTKLNEENYENIDERLHLDGREPTEYTEKVTHNLDAQDNFTLEEMEITTENLNQYNETTTDTDQLIDSNTLTSSISEDNSENYSETEINENNTAQSTEEDNTSSQDSFNSKFSTDIYASTTEYLNNTSSSHMTETGKCLESLGLEQGRGIFTASDYSPGYIPDAARLNSQTGWVGGLSLVHYIQVDLKEIWKVSGLLLQTHAQWPKNIIEEFQVLYSEDGIHWNKLRTKTDDSRFKTNFKDSSKSMHVFRSSVKAQFIVINPTRWKNSPGPALRMELFGCHVDNSFSEPIIPRNIEGDIMIDTIWEADVPYLVKNMIKVISGITLTLKPGVEIYFAHRMAGFVVEGTLISKGTAEKPIFLQSRELLSLLTARPFWRGLIFYQGGLPSKLSYTKITSAAAGVLTMANAVEVENIIFENCDCGFRIEGGTQISDKLLSATTFTGNNYGIQMYNISGFIKLSNLSFYEHKVTAIAGNLHDNYPITSFVNLTVTDIQIENASYALYITSYKSTDILIQNLFISDSDYGVYLELSDAAMSINVTIKDSVFTDSKLYSLLIDYKHLARFNPYLSIGNFKSVISNCIFNNSTNGLSYFSPEVFRNYQSVLEVDSCTFQGLQIGLMLQMNEQSSFKIMNSKFSTTSIKVIDITYSALDIEGEIKNNSIYQNVAETPDNNNPENDVSIDESSLIKILATGDSVMHGTLTVIGNDIRDNIYHCSLSTSLSTMHLSSNVFDNPNSLYELCINFQWIPGMNVLNASYNWWGSPNLINASKKIYDFFYDLDLGIVNISPILREPRVLGSSWDNATRILTNEKSIEEGGIVQGNLTISLNMPLTISSSIHIPRGSTLHLIGNNIAEFEINRGFLVEGSLHIEGNADGSFNFISQNNSMWKGFKMMHSESTMLQNVIITQSRGLLYVGTVPILQSVRITESYEVGLSATLIQPSEIFIENSEFDNNTQGIYLNIQGTPVSRVNLNIKNCKFTNNQISGIHIEAYNIASRLNITKNVFQNNFGKEFTAVLTDGYVLLNENFFNNSDYKSDYGPMIDIQYTGNCLTIPIPSRHLQMSQNIIHEESPAVIINSSCINSPSVWYIEHNTFISNKKMDINNSFITFDMPNNLYPWPLTLNITKNKFSCYENSMSALIFNVNHGENVVIEGNQILQCYAPIQVIGQNFHHNLSVTQNLFKNNGPIVFQGQVDESVALSFLNFSFNELTNNSDSTSVMKTSGYNANIQFNFFENPDAEYDLSVENLNPVNATYNWWGTADFNRILSRVFDGRLDFHRAEATLFPCLLSKNYSNVSTPYPDVFQIMDNVIGGSVQGNVTLPFSNKPYEVKYPIRIPPGSSLTIPGGSTLLFDNNTGIYSNGNLHLDGNETAQITLKPAPSTKFWKGIMIGQPRKEFMKVRLSGSNLPYTGRVEVLSSGTWLDVCSEYFGMTEGHVACKELGFSDVQSISSVNSLQNHYGMTNVKCVGLEMSLWDCNNNNGINIMCNTNKAATVTCKTSFNEFRTKRDTERINTAELSISTMQYVNILEADIGLQINNEKGIRLRKISVLQSKGPGMILNSAEISIDESIITGGGDIGLDIQGSNTVKLQGCNITENFLTALSISTEEINSSISLLNCEISGNGGDGFQITTGVLGSVNVNHTEVKRNGQTGAKIHSGSLSFIKSLIEEHPEEGANVNITGRLDFLNTAFSSNGGTDLNITIHKNNLTQSGLNFERSGFINSFGSTSRTSKDYVIYTSILSEDQGVFPITFFDCQILDTNSNAIFISAPNQILNMAVTNSTFEHINGIVIQLVSPFSPELHFQFNNIADSQNSFLLINSTS